jgi:hypothetical protein
MFEVMDPPGDMVTCRVCGRPLAGDRDDHPDPPSGPMCGDCYRTRESDQTIIEDEALRSPDDTQR